LTDKLDRSVYGLQRSTKMNLSQSKFAWLLATLFLGEPFVPDQRAKAADQGNCPATRLRLASA
jgi:hypothetical protein